MELKAREQKMQTPPNQLTRREFLRASLLLAGGIIITGTLPAKSEEKTERQMMQEENLLVLAKKLRSDAKEAVKSFDEKTSDALAKSSLILAKELIKCEFGVRGRSMLEPGGEFKSLVSEGIGLVRKIYRRHFDGMEIGEKVDMNVLLNLQSAMVNTRTVGILTKAGADSEKRASPCSNVEDAIYQIKIIDSFEGLYTAEVNVVDSFRASVAAAFATGIKIMAGEDATDALVRELRSYRDGSEYYLRDEMARAGWRGVINDLAKGRDSEWIGR